jgi:membrane-bound ClpP family serine protease
MHVASAQGWWRTHRWLNRPLLVLVAASIVLSASVRGGEADPPSVAVPASRQAKNIAILTIKGEITETTSKSVRRRLTLAERAGADALVIDLDTPGGEVWAVLTICQAIKSSSIKNTIAWIHPSAYSGGAIIALACREVVTSSPGTLGDALPVSSFTAFSQLPEHEKQKVLAPLMAELIESARLYGRDELLVQGLISRGVELWLVENSQTGERMTINAAEYETLFDESPSRGVPGLVSASTGEASGAASPSPTSSDSSRPRRSRRTRSDAGSSPSGLLEDPHPFIPATPELAALKGEMKQRPVNEPSSRPVLTHADRGKWRLVEYVSNGEGPFVFKADQLLHYELAASVVQNDEELKVSLGAKHLLRLDQSWSEGLVAFLTLLPVRGVLLVLFLLGLFIEMTHPGVVLPGAVAAVALLGLLAPPLLIDLANWWQVAAILGGIVLCLLEIFVIPGFGVAGILGVLLLMGGLIGTFVPEGSMFPDSPARERGFLYGAVTMLLSFATAGALMYAVARNFGSIPLLNKLVLKDVALADGPEDDLLSAMREVEGPLKIGDRGVAVTPLRPAGRAEIAGRVVDVVSEFGFLDAGQPIRVVAVTEFRIGVEHALGDARSAL